MWTVVATAGSGVTRAMPRSVPQAGPREPGRGATVERVESIENVCDLATEAALPVIMNGRSLAFVSIPTLTLALALSACSASPSSTPTGTEPATSSPSADGGVAADGAAPPSTPKGVCAALIDCMADIAPEAVGGLVSLYGEASNCWKGTPAEAEACGKACTKTLSERPECTSTTTNAHFLALCSTDMSNGLMKLDAEIAFSPRQGGTLVLRPLPFASSQFSKARALSTLPPLVLTTDGDRASGKTTTPFDLPAESLDPSFPQSRAFRVTSLAVTDFRLQGKGFCANEVLSTSEVGQVRGACVYLDLPDGAPIPRLDPSAVRSCRPELFEDASGSSGRGG